MAAIKAASMRETDHPVRFVDLNQTSLIFDAPKSQSLLSFRKKSLLSPQTLMT
jgi:hypothetical protein